MTDGFVIDTPEGIAAFRALQCYYALRIEVKTGMSHSQGSVMKLIKRDYLPGCKSNRKAVVFEEFQKYLQKEGILRG